MSHDGWQRWGSRDQWWGDQWRENQWWSDKWGSGQEWDSRNSWWPEPEGPKGTPRNEGRKSLRRLNTEDGKDYSNRTYLGGEERTSLTREDRLKLVWAVIHTLEPDVEWMWKPEWIQRADLQNATGTQLDAIIYLLCKFNPNTNLRTFKDFHPDTCLLYTS